MNILLDRKYKKESYTIGNLYIDGKFFCNTVEDTDRGLFQSMPLDTIKSKKIYARTAIPRGVYHVSLKMVSPKYSSKIFYKTWANGGRLPRLLDVPGFEGILMHCGNTAADSAGCIIVGKNKIKGGVTESKATFKELYKELVEAANKGESITINIV